ncbi:RNase H domain-containing protein [Trichonephila clavipes]|uniref:RNase H domain-containing protein n=1 Tax=Trichonephila clavipes TaxID=2585209 RepID=A0A8X6RGI4_TRICX|nr:RNase H domain-containing protein [Trichonephila clavipes]
MALKNSYEENRTKLRNSDGCSVFRSELIAIDTGLKEVLSIPGSNSLWILSDSRSAIQHLSNWHKVGDTTGVAILEKLKRFSSSREIHLQWVPLYVNIAGNEIADALAKYGIAQPTMNSAPLICSELHSIYINNRQEQTILTRFWSGHLQTLTFKDVKKVFPTCVRCSACQASPEHILDCLGLSKQDLYEDPLMILDILRVNEIMDLVQLV